jgi:hypothetical protein
MTGTSLQTCSCRSTRTTCYQGGRISDYPKLGFKDAAALEKSHKTVDLKYL